MDSLGARIRQLLEAKNLKQKQLAERLGIKPASVNQWVKGTARPDFKRLSQIAKELGVTLEELIEGTDEATAVNADSHEEKIEHASLAEQERFQYELRIKEIELEMERRVNEVQSELIKYQKKEIQQQQQEIERQRSLRPDQDAINK